MDTTTFKMAGAVARNPQVRLNEPVDLSLGADEQIAIVGPNGGGKESARGYAYGQISFARGKNRL